MPVRKVRAQLQRAGLCRPKEKKKEKNSETFGQL